MGSSRKLSIGSTKHSTAATIDLKEKQQLLGKLSETGRMLQSMIDKAASFCGPRSNCVREDHADYFTSADAPDTDD